MFFEAPAVFALISRPLVLLLLLLVAAAVLMVSLVEMLFLASSRDSPWKETLWCLETRDPMLVLLVKAATEKEEVEGPAATTPDDDDITIDERSYRERERESNKHQQ